MFCYYLFAFDVFGDRSSVLKRTVLQSEEVGNSLAAGVCSVLFVLRFRFY